MPDTPSRFAAIIAELRRRRVFRVAAVYACVAFIIIQIIDGAFDYLRIPEWVGATIIVLLVLGFFIAVGMAWAFDLTAEGLVRTREIKRDQPKKPPRPVIGNKALAVIALLAVIAAAWSWWGRPGKEAEVVVETGLGERSIAVLPFINMSADPEQEYFCDGMAEEIINALTHVENLRVIARTSTFAFKGEKIDIRKIGEQLNVESILEGSVRTAGNRVRISAQLINVADFSHLWSERYDRDMKDIFAIQDEISLAIVEALKVKLLKTEKAAIVKRHTEDLEAYNLYLKGNYYWQMLRFDKAIECYEQALQKDPHYALAYTGLASVYWWSSFFGNIPPNDAYPRAKEYAKKALEIDDTLAEAHASLGVINMNYDWNFKAAEREFKQALHLNPNSALTHFQYSFLLTLTEFHEEAISEAKRAQELDPLSSWINALVGKALFFSGRYDEAIEVLRITITMNPNYFYSHFVLGLAYRGKSMFEEAIAEFEKSVHLSGENSWIMAELAAAYYEFGKKSETEKIFDSLKQRSRDEYVAPMCFYWIHKVRGDHDQAFEWVKRACEEHDSFLPWLRVSPIEIARIPDEPRFQALLEQAGLE